MERTPNFLTGEEADARGGQFNPQCQASQLFAYLRNFNNIENICPRLLFRQTTDTSGADLRPYLHTRLEGRFFAMDSFLLVFHIKNP
ncbi:MAG: hypothetical protein NTZ74_16560 [Chloroflexi bacterium]|nr:hypothetical protein [Chloroflexota bacterium]